MARRNRDENTKMAASHSANALNDALGYLHAAVGALSEAQAGAHRFSALGQGADESALWKALNDALLAGDSPLHGQIKALRDRRAARAGFSGSDFDR